MATLCHTEYATRKRALIETSLLKLMGQQPYADITTTDLCREAGIPRRTFYHYFESKEAVLESMIDELMQRCLLNAAFDLRLGPEYVEQSFVQVFRFWDEVNRQKLDALIQNGLESRLITWASQWGREEQIGTLQKNNLDPKLAEIGQMVGATVFFFLLFYWCRGGYQETAEQMAEFAVWMMPRAFCNL